MAKAVAAGVRELMSSIFGSVESNTVSPMARHRCDVSSELYCPGAKPPLLTRFGVIPGV